MGSANVNQSAHSRRVLRADAAAPWAPLLKLPGELQTWNRGKKGTASGPEKRDLRETGFVLALKHSRLAVRRLCWPLGSSFARDDANGTEANVSRRELEQAGNRPSNFERSGSAS